MSKINVLTEDLINKIAAGEVIERPASVVKELIENSLDAESTRIEIEIKDSGKRLIRISDDGEGMSEEDAKKSILRHATSKISTADDLFSIKTLGFRGEALATIAAVSQLSLITKQKEKLEGFHIAVLGGEIISSEITAAEKGTTIEVHDLFFNTPARKKFLKTDAVELRHIIDVVIRSALANPKVFFKLIHEGHDLLLSPAVEDKRSNISSIYGLSLAKELLEVEYSDENVKASGFVAKPYQARNDKTQQNIFVNNRWVKNNDITKAVYDAFHSVLFVNKHPIFVLNFELDPEKIDVNVHPQKSEIKIEEKDKIYKAVYTAVKEALERNNLIPVLDFEFEQQLTFGTPQKKEKSEVKEENKYLFDRSKQTEISVNEFTEKKEVKNNFIFEKQETSLKTNGITAGKEYTTPEGDKIPPMKILGQIHKTYFVAETPGGMFLIDQHAVHERVLYEQFKEQLLNKKIEVQTLLQGDVLELTPSEKAMLLEHKKELEEFGFALSEFGENTFVVKTVPTLFGRIQHSEIIYELLSKLQEGSNKLKEKYKNNGSNNKLEEIQEEIIIKMACRAAVKAGDELTINQINNILDDLSICERPYTCPHGRPAMIKTMVNELERKFRRK